MAVDEALPYLEKQLHETMGTTDAQKGLMAFLKVKTRLACRSLINLGGELG